MRLACPILARDWGKLQQRALGKRPPGIIWRLSRLFLFGLALCGMLVAGGSVATFVLLVCMVLCAAIKVSFWYALIPYTLGVAGLCVLPAMRLVRWCKVGILNVELSLMLAGIVPWSSLVPIVLLRK